MTDSHPHRAVVVGAGPAGFYAAEQLLSAGFEVDVLDALPTPFGLVRSGVAPDHPNIKACRACTRRPPPAGDSATSGASS
jgi:ferredoxin--NADP+ reductase